LAGEGDEHGEVLEEDGEGGLDVAVGGGFFGGSHGHLAALAHFPTRATFEEGPSLAFGQKPEVNRATDMPFVLIAEALEHFLICQVVNWQRFPIVCYSRTT